MSTSITLNGVSYSIPAVGEGSWGLAVSNYLIASSTGLLSKAGGSFTLTADADFGATYGLKSGYYKSRGTVSTAGVVRVANDESIGWRNAANGANLLLKVNSSNVLEFNGNPIVTLALGTADYPLKMNSAGTAYEFARIINASVDPSAAIAYSKLNLSGSIVNADVNASAAIAVSKLAATTASRALVSDASGFVSAATTTSTEIGYVNGVTSAIQTQLDAKQARSTLTTKGDIYAATASATVARLGVGTDGQVLTAASGETTGLSWTSPLTNPMDSEGDLIVGGAAGAATKLDAGTAGQFLKAAGAAAPVWSWGQTAASGADSDTTLVVGDSRIQIVTPTAQRTYTLPTTSVLAGDIFTITNNAAVSSANLFLNIYSSGANLVRVVYPQTTVRVMALQNTPTTAAHWSCLDVALSEWAAFTPTFGNITVGNGTVNGLWRRNGDEIEVRAHLTWGTTTSCAGSVTLNIPVGSINTAKLGAGSSTTAGRTLGFTSARDDSTGETYGGRVGYAGATSVNLYADYAVTSTFLYTGNPINNTQPYTWATSDRLDVQVKVPVTGWTSTKG